MVEGQKVYKPTSKMSQLFCLLKNEDFMIQTEIDNLIEQGYQIILEEDGRQYHVTLES
jgi:hypothetical protein